MNDKYLGKVFDEKEIREALRGHLSHWNYSNGSIRRVFTTGGWRASLMIANAVGHLSEVAWHHPKLIIQYDEVEILLNTHEADGVTDRDFALAEKIEGFIYWIPGENDDERLPGLPEEPEFTYISR